MMADESKPQNNEGAPGNNDQDTKEGKPNSKGKGEVDEKTVEAALSLYHGLQDPETGREIIEMLARKAGLLDKEGDLKEGTTKKSAEKKIESISRKYLRDELGKDYEKFADTLGPVFDKIIEHYLKDINTNIRAESTKEKWDAAVDTFVEEFEVPTKVEKVMMELMEDSPPNVNRKGFNAQRYLKRIYNAAMEELGEEPKTRKSKDTNEGDMFSKFVVRDAPKGEISIDDAVEAAIRGIRFRK